MEIGLLFDDTFYPNNLIVLQLYMINYATNAATYITNNIYNALIY